MVSSSVSPVNTRIVSCFSPAVSVPHDGRSLDTGTFSGSQKLPVSRSQTSASFSSCSRFQLIAETRSISFIFVASRTHFTRPFACGTQTSNTTPGVRQGRATQEVVFACRQPAAPTPHLRGGQGPATDTETLAHGVQRA